MKKMYDVETVMRDGLVLRSNIYLPEEGGCYPVIFMRTPYEKESLETKARYTLPKLYTEAGYGVVVQDCRGTGRSDGRYQPWLCDAEDGYDTVEWIASQPWCSGKIGMMGSSNLGATQLLTASMRPPHLTCICPSGTSAGFPFFKNGIFDLAGTSIWYMQQAVRTSQRAGMEPEELKKLKEKMEALAARVEEQVRCLPVKDMPFANVKDVQMDLFFLDYLKYVEDISHWSKLHMPADLRAIEVPALWIMNWYDHLQKCVLEGYHEMKKYCVPSAQENLYLYFGPWRVYAGVEGSDSENCIPGDITEQPVWGNGKRLSDILIDWFDYWLKGDKQAFPTEDHVYLHTLGAEKRWRYEKTWPLPGTKWTKYFLSSQEGVNSLSGDGWLTTGMVNGSRTDTYFYDPMDPVPTKSGIVINPKDHLVQDQTSVEEREDVLIYTSDILKEKMEITGPVRAKIWASTDGKDTDFVVKMIDVHPDGVPYNLIEGVVRARFRYGWDRPELLVPNAVYEYDIDLGGIGIVLDEGHSLRIEVSSSNFPKWDRNLNTGNPIGQDNEVRTARQTIYHDEEHPSHIVIPVIE